MKTRHREAGAVSTLMYGGTAKFYNIAAHAGAIRTAAQALFAHDKGLQ